MTREEFFEKYHDFEWGDADDDGMIEFSSRGQRFEMNGDYELGEEMLSDENFLKFLDNFFEKGVSDD